MRVSISYGAVDMMYYNQWFKRDYFNTKNLLLNHSVNDSVPMLVDRTNNNGVICKIDLLDLVVEAEFNDDELKILFHQIYKIVDEECKYSDSPVLVVIDEEAEIAKIIKDIAFIV